MPYTDLLKSDQCLFLNSQFGFDVYIRGFQHIGVGLDGQNRPWRKAWAVALPMLRVRKDQFLRLWLFSEMDQGMSTSDDYKNYVQLLNRGTMLKPRSYRLTAIHHQATVHKKTLVIMAVSRYSSVWKKPILMPAIQSCNICKEITISTRPTTDVRLIFYVFLYILFAKYRWRCSG